MKRQMMNCFLVSFSILFGLIAASTQGIAYSGEGQKALILKSGSVPTAKDAMSQAGIRFAERMKQKTNGKIQITHYPDSQLGKERQMFESIRTGAMAMTVSGMTASNLFKIVVLPYLFRDRDHVTKVLDGEITEEWARRDLEKTGFYVFGWVYRGFRHCTFAKVPVRTPADMKGMKFRVPEDPVWLETWLAVGARPTPLAGGELYLALKQGVVDGQENTLDSIMALSMWEVQKHLVLTGHACAVGWATLSKQIWENLTPETRRVWIDTWKEVSEELKREMVIQEQEFVAGWRSKGGTVIEPDVGAFREATKDVWKKFAPQTWGEGVYEKIKATK